MYGPVIVSVDGSNLVSSWKQLRASVTERRSGSRSYFREVTMTKLYESKTFASMTPRPWLWAKLSTALVFRSVASDR